MHKMKYTKEMSKTLLSVKNDFVFKLLFGDQNHKDILIAFLSAIMKVPKSEFQDIKIINTELFREFKEDKKGILDVRAKTSRGEQIDIEIQILPTELMPERSLFYWSKMYTSQIKSGDAYDKLKKCVTINIVDFICTPLKKIYSSFHLTEDETKYKLTDILEIYFLEIPKLLNKNIIKDADDPVVQWMEFIDGKSEGVLKMLAEKNKDIKNAYDYLQIISKDEKARMAYEAREAELHDQMTRIKSAMDKGKIEGALKGAIKVAKNLLKMGLSIEKVAEAVELPVEDILKIKEKMQ